MVVIGILVFFIPTASAYVDAYGRVIPGRKPSKQKVVKNKVKAPPKVKKMKGNKPIKASK